MKLITITKAALPLGAALALAACGGAEEAAPATDVPDDTVQDLSGGEIIAAPADEGVEVNLPETEMTPATPEEVEAAAEQAAE